MATLGVSNTFSDGDVISAAEMNENFDDVEAFVNNGIPLDNLATPYHLINYSFYHHDSISAAGYIVFRFSTPDFGALVPKRLSLSALVAGSGTVKAQVHENPGNLGNPTDNDIMSEDAATTVDYTPKVITTFSDTTIAADTPMAIKVLADGDAVSQVAVVMTFAVKHTS